MAAKLTRLAHKIVIQLNLVAESCTTCSSCSRLPVQKILDTPLYKHTWTSDGKTQIDHILIESTAVKHNW